MWVCKAQGCVAEQALTCPLMAGDREATDRLARLWKVESDRVRGEGERLTGTQAAFVTEARAFPAEGAVGVDSWDDVNLALRSHT